MNNITEELENRACVICLKCWKVFAGCARLEDRPCPECGEHDSLRWIGSIKPIV